MSRPLPNYGISVYALIRNRRGRFLLLKRSRSSRFSPGKWEMPGGKLEAGECPAHGLAREVEEETGLRVRSLRFRETVLWRLPELRIISLVFDATVNGGAVQLSDAHEEFQWRPPRRIQKTRLTTMARRVLFP